MNRELASREGRHTSLTRRNVGLSWGGLALFSLGLVMVLLSVSVLPGAKALADEPCSICAEASDPVQATYLALRDTSAAGLMIGDASDPLQYTFAADLAASAARAAEVSRLRGLAGPGAGRWPAYDEVVRLRGLLEATASGTMTSSDDDGEIARLWGLASPGAASRVRSGEIARLWGLAGSGAASRVRTYELAHLRGLLEAAASSEAANLAREAEIARLRGLSGPGAAYGTAGSECAIC